MRVLSGIARFFKTQDNHSTLKVEHSGGSNTKFVKLQQIGDHLKPAGLLSVADGQVLGNVAQKLTLQSSYFTQLRELLAKNEENIKKIKSRMASIICG
jgi:hypothetical protein